MKEILLSWLILTVSMYLTAVLLPGFQLKGFIRAFFVAALFGVLNWAIGWLLFAAIGVVTLGVGFLLAFITRWIVTAIVLKITDALSSSLTIKGFGTALLAALLMSLFGTGGEWLLRLSMH